MKTFFSKVFLIMLVATALVTGNAMAVTDTTAPSISMGKSSGSTIEPKSTFTFTVTDNESYIKDISYYWANNDSNRTMVDGTKRIEYSDLVNRNPYYGMTPTAPSDPGEYEFCIDVTNGAGLRTYAEYTYYIQGDTSAPVITASIESGSTIELNSTVVVTITEDESNIVEASYTINNGISDKVTNNANKKVIFNIKNFNLEKTYIVDVVAKNADGVEATKRLVYYVKDTTVKDTELPKVTASVEDETVTVKVTDNVELESIKYSWDSTTDYKAVSSVSGKSKTFYLDLPSTTKTHILRVVAKDTSGNETTFVYTIEVEEKIITTPVITADYASGSTIDLLTTVTFTIKDSGNDIIEASYDCNGIYQKITEKDGKVANRTWEIRLTNFNLVQKYTVVITAKNEAGVETTETFIYYVRDNEEADTEAPQVGVSVAGGSNVSAGQTITVILKDNKALKSGKYSWDSTTNYETVSNVSGTSKTFNVTVPTAVGTHTLRVLATDQAGNESGVKTFVYYVKATEEVDDNDPTIKANPSSGNIKPSADITITAEDDVSLMTVGYYWDDDDATIKTISGKTYNITVDAPSAAGKHVLHTFACDKFGNGVEKDFTYNVLDNEKPTISVNPKSGSTVVGGKVIKATLRDDSELARVEYNWKGETVTKESISGTYKVIELPAISSKAGTYYMYITVTDAAGNSTSEVYTYYVEDDNDDEGDIPTVDADPSKGTLEYGDRITITAEDDDGIDYVEYYWDDDNAKKKYSDEFTVKVPSEEGKHYLYVRATDELGNRCSYERFTYTIEENNYPGNPDITGDLNKKVKELRVEIRNGDDKIKFEPEEEILYYIDYYNGSSSKVTNAKIVVDLPTYLEGIEASDSGKVTSKKVTWNLGTLNKGEYGRVSFTAQYTSDKYNEKIITVPAKIYSGSSLKDTSTVRNLIYCDDGSGSGSHAAYCVGYPSGAFRPNGNITRAELATMIANIEGITSTYRGQFTDVEGHWAADKIQACVERGYVNPLGYNYFGAEQYATRADLAYAIAAILDVEDLEPIFIYSSDLAYSDARCAMEQLLRLGIMDGYSDGTSKPDKNITRAEAVTIINNYLFRGELYTRSYNYSYNYNTNYNYGGSNYILQFTDLTPSHWAYGHIMEAVNDHRYVRTLDGNEEML